MQIEKDSSTEYILEVDSEYPQELHDIHNDYPLAWENINISKRMVIWLLFKNFWCPEKLLQVQLKN